MPIAIVIPISDLFKIGERKSHWPTDHHCCNLMLMSLVAQLLGGFTYFSFPITFQSTLDHDHLKDQIKHKHMMFPSHIHPPHAHTHTNGYAYAFVYRLYVYFVYLYVYVYVDVYVDVYVYVYVYVYIYIHTLKAGGSPEHRGTSSLEQIYRGL